MFRPGPVDIGGAMWHALVMRKTPRVSETTLRVRMPVALRAAVEARAAAEGRTPSSLARRVLAAEVGEEPGR